MKLEPLQDITKLTPLVVRVLGLNPGTFQLQGTNTYLVGGGKSRLLVDTGEGVDGYVPLVKRALAENGGESISDVLITHYHFDHTEGLKDLKATWPELRAWKLDPGYNGVHGPSFNLVDAGVKPLVDGQKVSTADGDATLCVLATPGHTPDHCAFLLEQENNSVFSGDCVLGGSSAVFEDLHAYMGSLQKMLTVLEDDGCGPTRAKRTVYPGHGIALTDGAAAVSEYIKHRTARETQVVQALEGYGSSLTPFGIVRRVYLGLSWKLIIPAAWNTRTVLKKLEADGLASCSRWIRCSLPLGLDWMLFERWKLLKVKK